MVRYIKLPENVRCGVEGSRRIEVERFRGPAVLGFSARGHKGFQGFRGAKGEFPKIRGTLFWDPYNKDPTI